MNGQDYTFSRAIKAARMGYHWHDRMKAFVRVCDSGDKFLVRLVTPNDLTNLRSNKPMPERHRCWWEGDGDPFALTALKNVVRIKRSVLLTLDYFGKLVESA